MSIQEDLRVRFDKPAPPEAGFDQFENGWLALHNAYEQARILEFDHIGKSSFFFGSADRPFQVTLSNGIVFHVDQDDIHDMEHVLPVDSISLQYAEQFNKTYFNVATRVSHHDEKIHFGFGKHTIELNIGVSNTDSMSLTERFTHFDTASRLAIFGILTYPALADIKERGILVGDPTQPGASALALPGRILNKIKSSASHIHFENDELYVLDSEHDAAFIASLPQDFLKDIQPVGVLFE